MANTGIQFLGFAVTSQAVSARLALSSTKLLVSASALPKSANLDSSTILRVAHVNVYR